MGRKNKNDELNDSFQDDFDNEKYYDRHPLQIPEGCRACGGPYPSCKSSCPMFDD